MSDKTKVKICGMRRSEDIAHVNELKPDYVGFILCPGFRRTISFEEAATLKKELSKDIKAVGVFLDQSIEEILKVVNEGTIDVIQLHGHENNDYIKKLKSQVDKKIIKVISVSDEKDILKANETNADLVLLDAKSPGSGKTFDWKLLTKVDVPFALAGGLSKDNVKDALLAHPVFVDVSSGVETEGVKDYKKIKEFLEIVRGE